MPRYGAMRDEVAFQKRVAATDDYGNEGIGEWTTQFTRLVEYIMRPGNETVQAARLDGRQPITVAVPYDSQVSQVTPEWRLLELRGQGRVLNIRASEDMDRRGRWWTLECEAGVPT
jgi:SPP1 family predicted phage head-tail adaptor